MVTVLPVIIGLGLIGAAALLGDDSTPETKPKTVTAKLSKEDFLAKMADGRAKKAAAKATASAKPGESEE